MDARAGDKADGEMAPATVPVDGMGPWDQLRAYLATPEPEPDPARDHDVEDDHEPPDDPHSDPQAPATGNDPLRVPQAIGRLLQSDLVQRVAGLRTPGGLFPLVVFILFMIFAIVPVNSNGDTRIFLLWRALTGGAFLPLSAAHQRRLAEAARIRQDNATAAQIAQAAGEAASAASVIVSAAGGGVVEASQAGWDTFWATSGGVLEILSGQGG